MRAAIVLVASVVASILPMSAAAAETPPSPPPATPEAPRSLIVEVERPDDRDDVIDAARRAGGDAEVLDGRSVAVQVDSDEVDGVTGVPGVRSVRDDRVATRTLEQSVPWTGAPALWAQGHIGTGSTVAVLDDGVDKNHEMLAGSVVAEACFTDGHCPGGTDQRTTAGSGVACPGCGHGTAVAGVVRSSSNLLRGVAPDSSLFPIQVYGCSSCGAFESDLIKALDHIGSRLASTSVDVVNMSLTFRTGPHFTTECDSAFPQLSAAVNRLTARGVVVVVSSGNDGRSDALPAPACFRNVVAVAASATPGSFSGFSNRGPGTDMSAPGSGITTTATGGGVITVDGTSFSAPHVAGAVAVLRDLEPGLRVDQIQRLLTTPHRTVTGGGITLPELALDQLHDGLPSGSLAPGALRVTGDYEPIVAQFSGDERTEILWYAPGSAADYLWSANARGELDSRSRPVGGTYRPVIGDFDGNGFDDIVWYAPGGGSDYVWWSSGTGAFESRPLSIGGTYTTVVGNFDGAPGDELIFYAPGSAPDYQWTTGGSRTFRSANRRIDGSYVPVVVDIVSNARDEIVWRSGGSDYLWTYASSGAVTSVPVSAPGGEPAVGDFDGDGKEDIAWSTSPVTMWWGSPGASGSASTLGASASGSFVVADVDGVGGDELLDVVPGTGDAVWSFSSSRVLSTGPAPIDHDGTVLVLDIGVVGRDDLLVYAPGVDDLLLTSIGPG